MSSRIPMPYGMPERLMEAWVKSGLTVAQVAKEAGIKSNNTIYCYMNGQLSPSAGYLLRLCETLNISPNYLLTGCEVWNQ